MDFVFLYHPSIGLHLQYVIYLMKDNVSKKVDDEILC